MNLVKKFAPYVLAIVLILNIGLFFASVFGLFSDDISTPPVIQTPAPGVTTITLPQSRLTKDIIETYFDPQFQKPLNDLLKENKELKAKVTQLSATVAWYQSNGGGTVVFNIDPTSPTAPAVTPVLPRFTFKDWRLSLVGENNRISYELKQQFVIVHSLAYNRDKVATNLFELYEVGPNNELFPAVKKETRTVVTTAPSEGWYVKPTLQGGWMGLTQLANAPTASVTNTGAGVLAGQWLKRGKTRMTEDTRWAFLTPSVAITPTEVSVGVLPVSFNVGTLRHQPFTNLWVSPFLGTTNGTTINRVGGVISVTF